MRHHRQLKPRRLATWPPGVPSPDAVAAKVRYVGSAEHKDHPSPAGAPALRKDASPCDPRYKTFDEPDRALKQAVEGRQTSEFQGQFPKYVWGFLDGQLYEARLVNHERGEYKAYPLAEGEAPEDPLGLLPVTPWNP